MKLAENALNFGKVSVGLTLSHTLMQREDTEKKAIPFVNQGMKNETSTHLVQP